MNERQFDYAVKGLRLSDENLSLVKKILVDRIGRKELLSHSEKSQAAISRAIARVHKNLQKRLEQDGFCMETYIFPIDMKEEFDGIEIQTISHKRKP